jgi:hypothetical protein
MLRLDIADNQIDAVLADSYSGAGVVALDLTATPGSLLVHDNRVRDRFPQGETMLVSGVAEATVTGNLVANEVVNVTTPTAVLPQSRSLSLLPTDLLAVPAVAITGNVLVDPAMLPQRTALDQQSIAAVFQVWDFLNTITAYVAPASPSASPSSPSATPSVAPT